MSSHDERLELERERSELLATVERWVEGPLLVLGFVWLALLVVELVHGLSPFFIRVGQIIWAIFILDFVLRFALAPGKIDFLRNNWLTLIALLLPAIRVLRVFRIARALRGLRLVRIVGSVNRWMRALGHSMQRRGLPYVLALTLVVLTAGAAGMFAFENPASGGELGSYAEALWWTAMLLTTIGTDYWPRTAEGRALTMLLSLYALGILGYVAGTLATFFIGREAEAADSDIAGEGTLRELRLEISLLRDQLSQAQLPTASRAENETSDH